jgi:hypothetical protein
MCPAQATITAQAKPERTHARVAVPHGLMAAMGWTKDQRGRKRGGARLGNEKSAMRLSRSAKTARREVAKLGRSRLRSDLQWQMLKNTARWDTTQGTAKRPFRRLQLLWTSSGADVGALFSAKRGANWTVV